MRAYAAMAIAGALLGTIPVNAETPVAEIIEEAGLTEGPVAMRDRPNWRAPEKIVVRTEYGLVDRLNVAFPDLEIVGADTSEEAATAIRDADAVIGFCDAEVVERAERLVWIQVFSAGVENCLALDRVANGEILLTNMQKVFSPVIAEHAIAMMMSLARGLTPYAKAMPKGEWDDSIAEQGGMTSLQGKTMLVVGLGGIGTGVARRADGLRMRVIATRNSSREGPEFVDHVGLPDELLDLAAEADVVVNALPLTPNTTNLFDKAFFDAVKPGALFINVGRGGSVVTDELVAALGDGRIGGAGLDVTEPEPLPPDHALWQIENVIITPHIAASGYDRSHDPVVLEENLRRFVAGDPLLNVVDPARGY